MIPAEYPRARDYGGTRRAVFPEPSVDVSYARIIRKHIDTNVGISLKAVNRMVLSDLRKTNHDHTDLLRVIASALPHGILLTQKIYEILTEYGLTPASEYMTESLFEASNVINRTFRPFWPYEYTYLKELLVTAARSDDPVAIANIISERRLQSAEEVTAISAELKSVEQPLSAGAL